MLVTYEKFASLIKDELVLCPTEFPYLYNNFQTTQLFLENKKHWRVVEEILVTFLTSKKFLIKYWDIFISMAKINHTNFEKPLHEIYSKLYCLSPVPSPAKHCANINSIYGIYSIIN
jgi:hypothetical protein